jgi:multiple antibiotic resistance protein
MKLRTITGCIMAVDVKKIFTATMILFAVIDIIGSIPISVDLRHRAAHI